MTATYVRSPEGHGVDFLARHPGGGSDLIQVCAIATDAATLDRELRALAEAGRRFPKAIRRIPMLPRDALPKEVPAGVVAQPAYEWFLTPSESGSRSSAGRQPRRPRSPRGIGSL